MAGWRQLRAVPDMAGALSVASQRVATDTGSHSFDWLHRLQSVAATLEQDESQDPNEGDSPVS